MSTGISVAVVLLCSLTFYFDLRSGKIPNWIVYPAWLLGLAMNFAASSFQGIIFSLKGLGLGFLLLFPFFVLGMMGAGDVKLVMAIGALKGSVFCLYVVLYSFIVGMAIGLAMTAWKGRLIQLLKSIWQIVKNSVVSLFLGQSPLIALKQKGMTKFKFGIAIALAGIWVLILEFMQIEYRFLH